MLATPRADGVVGIAGDPAHPANLGRLCVKGAALGETLGLEHRLLAPELADTDAPIDQYGLRVRRPGSWDEALARVAEGFTRVIAEHGPDAVAMYVSGQLLTEDYYLTNKFMKGFVGSANIDTNSRLCMSSAVAGHKRAFGEDLVPGCYEDFEAADLVVLVGSNTAWCHPVLFQRLTAAKKARPGLHIVVVDPRRTATCELADTHLAIAPGSDVALFNGLLAWLHQHGITDANFVDGHTDGAARAVAVATGTGGSAAHVARACGLAEDTLKAFYALWAGTEKVVTAFSQGVNQSSSGTDKVNAIINCHLFTGRIGKPGATPFSITGQPNAMGGREVGGLANTLAAHLEFSDAAHRRLVENFWQATRMATTPGLKAVELFEAIHAGRVKAVWIIATNPVVSMPDADRVREALVRCELVVVSEVMARTDTADLAHVLLPAQAWGEKDGTVTNSDRRISRQRAFLPTPGLARADWWAVAGVARGMGFPGFTHATARNVFDEHARLSATGNSPASDGGIPRVFDLGGLVGLSETAYRDLAPRRWPVPAIRAGLPDSPTAPSPDPEPEPAPDPARLFADGRFAHADGRARLVPVMPRAPAHRPDDDFPLVLNTGRVRDQWHTMSRTGQAPRLAEHVAEPFVEIHPHDALLRGVHDGHLVRVATRWGACVVRAKTTFGVGRRCLFVPIHWNGRTASDARVGALVNPVVDPLSGEPEFKHTPARIEPFFIGWHGFVFTQAELPDSVLRSLPHLAWWTRVQGRGFFRYEIAGRGEPQAWTDWARSLLGVSASDSAGLPSDWLEAHDPATTLYRSAWLDSDRLRGCVFVAAPAENLPGRAWLAGLFGKATLDEQDRTALLAGMAPEAGADVGPIVCSCFGVGRNPIVQAIRAGCTTPDALGQKLHCGTNCGSCIAELRQLILATRQEIPSAGLARPAGTPLA